MDAVKWMGLSLMGSGIFALIIYGIYNMLRSMGHVDPIIFVSAVAILTGIVILLITVIVERMREKEKISEEDLKT